MGYCLLWTGCTLPLGTFWKDRALVPQTLLRSPKKKSVLVNGMWGQAVGLGAASRDTDFTRSRTAYVLPWPLLEAAAAAAAGLSLGRCHLNDKM